MGRYDQTEQQTSKALIITVITLIVIAALLTGLYLGRTKKVSQDDAVQQLTLPKAGQIATTDNSAAITKTEQSSAIFPATEEVERKVINVRQRIDLPPLSESDPLFRQEIERLSLDFRYELTAPHLLEKYLQLVNDFSQGQRVAKHMRFLRLREPFLVENDEQGGWFIAQRSYHRYDRLAQAFAAIDTDLAIKIYQKLEPLMLQVFAGFGYPETYHLQDIFQKAAAEIISAPVIEGRIAVVRPSVDYKFADKKLEALNPVHKQMLRMGPDNTQMIQKKLRELVERFVQMNKE